MRSSINPADAPFYSFQKRLRSGELGAPDLDNRFRRLYRVSGYRQFIADVEDSDIGDEARPTLTAGRCSSLDLSRHPVRSFHER